MRKAAWRTIYIATLETRNFTFEAYGEIEAAARIALNVALGKHARQHNLEEGWYDEEAIQIRDVQLGWGYRDREIVR